MKRDNATPRWCRETARSYGVQRDRATLQRTEKPRDATSCRGTARHCVVQRDRAMSRGADGPSDAIWCRETSRSYGVHRDSATLQRTEKARDATSCRGTARHYVVQRQRDATACRGKSCKLKSFCGILDGRRGELDAPCPSRRTLDAGEPTPNTLSVAVVPSSV